MQDKPFELQVKNFNYFKSAGLKFHSAKVVYQFLGVTLAMVLVPLTTFFSLRNILLPLMSISEKSCTTIGGIMSALSIWVVMGYYAYLVVKDPVNFKYESEQRKQMMIQKDKYQEKHIEKIVENKNQQKKVENKKKKISKKKKNK